MDNIKFQKCFIYAEVTGISAAPYGGTLLGYSKEGTEYFPNIITVDEEVEEEAGISDTIDIGSSPYLSVILTEWQAATLKYMFSSGRITGSTTTTKVQYPGGLIPGKPVPSYKFLVVPEDSTNNYSLYIPNGQPLWKQSESLKMKLKEYSVYPLIIRCKAKALASSDGNYNQRRAVHTLLANITVF